MNAATSTSRHPAFRLRMIRLGLCCSFRDQPIKFPTTTAMSLSRIERSAALAKLGRLCRANADALLAALQTCVQLGIGCFRVNSQILPLKTHPTCGYEIEDLPDGDEILARFRQCGQCASDHELRTCFHPDQFVVLNSPRAEVVAQSIRELEYQAEVAGWIGADVINIHAGGAYGNKRLALEAFVRNVDRLPIGVRQRLTIENDDRVYSPAELLPICRATGLPLVYDVHHHRCLPDGLYANEATAAAIATWSREPLFHISSPLEGWNGPRPRRHHDFIDPQDFPDCWRQLDATIEVEAKAKELAVLMLRQSLHPDKFEPS